MVLKESGMTEDSIFLFVFVIIFFWLTGRYLKSIAESSKKHIEKTLDWIGNILDKFY